jgi:3-isopropylmalate/(R)-2-methylmalate dehydratase large subunit
MGARGGMIAQIKRLLIIEGRLCSKRRCLGYSRSLLENIKTDADAKFDEEINFDASDIEPMITTELRNGIRISKSIQTLKMLLKEKKLMLNLWVIWGSTR